MAKKGGTGQQGGLEDFTLVEGFRSGYRNREDKTTLPPGILVEGSQNVLTNTFQRVGNRKGYTLDGQADATLAPIARSFDWFTSKGYQRNMRAGYLTSAGNDAKLQYRYVDAANVVTWRDLLAAQVSPEYNFTTFWDFTTEKIEVMLAVNGQPEIVEWSGAITTLAAASDDSLITVTGGGSVTQYGPTSGTAPITAPDNGGVGATLAGYIWLTAQPTDGQTLTIVINSTGVNTIHFVSVIGATAGNVLIGATVADTTTNLLGLLQTPGSTNATQVAVDGGSQTLLGDITFGTSAGTLTKNGVTTWAEEGFYLNGTRQVTINGTVYGYTGGEYSTTLTGITPDPSAEPADSIVHQTPRITPNAAITALPPTFKNTLISNLSNQIYIGASDQNSVYISKVNNYKDFSFATPRVVGEGALVTPDSVPTAFIPQESSIYITAGMDEWYDMSFTLSSDNVAEAISINRLNTASQQAAQSQLATSKINNSIIYLSHEPIVNTFGRVDNVVLTPQISDISFPIVNDMNVFDFTGAALWYYRKFVYMSVPAEGIVMMYNMTDPANPYWEAPQRLSISCFSIIDGELYGHSSLVPETYKLFDGYNDNGDPIDAIALFSFNNYGTRSSSKAYNEFYVEGYITTNTTLTLGIQFDIDGCATNLFKDIAGDDTQIVCIGGADNSLGKNALGKVPLGSLILPTSATLPPKFRVIKTFTIDYFYEDQIGFESSGIDEQWEIICFGPQLTSARDLNNNITQ